jgi:acetylornithine deacetylase/succinyl-diaminopimelate desuccinylase-like protein
MVHQVTNMDEVTNPVAILEQLVKFPTYQVTADEVADGMKACSAFLSSFLEQLGFNVRIDELFNVTAERKFSGEKTFLINTHFDTVPPAKGWKQALEPRQRNRRLYGLGSSDAKGGIAAAISALSQLENCRFAKLVVQFMNYEDNAITYRGTRWLGMPYFLSKNPQFKPDYGINVEPTVAGDELTLSIGCTGRLAFTVKTIGKGAHSSTPQEGQNAIYDMMRVIEALRGISPGRYKINGFESEMPINVATIQGGRAINIVPGECSIACERRLFPGEHYKEIKKTIGSALSKVKDAKVECRFGQPVQEPYAINRTEEIVLLVRKSISDTLGYDPSIRIELGRTDSTYLHHNAGVKTVIVGPGHTGHVENEFISVNRLLEFTRVLRNLLTGPSR